MKSGHGKLTMPDESYFSGNFSKNKPSGSGKHYKPEVKMFVFPEYDPMKKARNGEVKYK